jgi:hypothetical protein
MRGRDGALAWGPGATEMSKNQILLLQSKLETNNVKK